MIVVDASVAVKWIVPEPDNELANAILRSGASLFAPDLARVEVCGALSRKVREGLFSVEDARTAHSKWCWLLEEGALTLCDSSDLIDRAFDIALAARHAVADCVYIACAEHLGAAVLTADHAMFERGGHVYDRIELLSRSI